MTRLAHPVALLCGTLALTACGSSNNPPADAAVNDTATADTVITDTPATGDNGADAPPSMGMCNVEGGAACFVLPTAPVRADDGDAGVADFSCMAPMEMRSTGTIAVTGRVRDFQSGDPVANATVDVFGDDNFEGMPLASGTSNTMGEYMLTLPMGTPNFVNWRVRARDTLDTFSVRDPINVAQMMLARQDRESVATSTGRALPALIGMQRREMTGIVAGEASDCRGRSLRDAIVTLSTASSGSGATPPAFVDRAQVYYFSSADLPVSRTTRTTTNANGLFVILQVPPTQGTSRYHVQVWGFRDMAAVGMGRAGLSLLAETPVRVPADVVVIANLPARPQ